MLHRRVKPGPDEAAVLAIERPHPKLWTLLVRLTDKDGLLMDLVLQNLSIQADSSAGLPTDILVCQQTG